MPVSTITRTFNKAQFANVSSALFRDSTTQDKQIEPWYPSHPERDLYVSLLNQTDPKPNDALLKAALIRRAMTDVKRVVKLREDKPALQNLVQKGSVGDDLWNAMLAAEKELEAELLEVINEANSFVPGWGQIIFQTAGEMVQNERMREIFEEIPQTKAKQGLYASCSSRKSRERID